MNNLDKFRDEFDTFLDEQVEIIRNRDGEITIGENFARFPSQILYELDEIAYYEQLAEYVEQKKQEHSQIVYQNFPAPIAFFYRQTEDGYDDEQHRLHLLRSTWESLIYILYALIFGEVNHKRFNLADVKIFGSQRIRQDHTGIMSDKLGWKVEAMQRIVEYDQQNHNNLMVSSHVESDMFEVIRGLNHERNSFSHVAALDSLETNERFEELYPIVSDLLFELDFLENVSLLRYIKSLDQVHKIRFNKYGGHALQRQNLERTLSPQQLVECLPLLSNKLLLMEFNGLIFNVSPFIHFHGDGQSLKLAYFKSINRENGNYIFELVGATKREDREFAIDCSSLPSLINNSIGDLL